MVRIEKLVPSICVGLVYAVTGFPGSPALLAVSGMRHTLHPTVDDTTLGNTGAPGGPFASAASDGAHAISDSESDLAAGAQTPPPFVIDDATVRGPASAEAQAAFDDAYRKQAAPAWSGGLRGLLHGRRRAAQYAQCPRCTIVRCSQSSDTCDGHCKRSRRLFDCSGPNPRRKSGCRRISDVDLRNGRVPVRDVQPLDSFIVTAPSPYIGCMHGGSTAGTDIEIPSGCPPPGTLGVTDTGLQYKIRSRTCSFTAHLPNCAFEPSYPVGLCWCRNVDLDGRFLAFEPCDITELQIDNSGPGRGDEIRAVVETRGSVTFTGIADYNEPDASPTYVYTVPVPTNVSMLAENVDEVDVVLEVFEQREVTADALVEEGPVSDDYYDSPAPGDGGVVASRRNDAPPRVPLPPVPFRIADCLTGYDADTQRRSYDWDCVYYDIVDPPDYYLTVRDSFPQYYAY